LKFLKKDMNKILLLLVLVPLLLFAGFSAYYQGTLKNISTEYSKNTEQLEKITARLVSEETKSNETLQLKETVQKDKETLEGNYNEIKNENQALKKEKAALEQDLISTKSELSKTESELQTKKSEFDILKGKFQQIQNSLIEANDQISRLISRVSELCSSECSDDEC